MTQSSPARRRTRHATRKRRNLTLWLSGAIVFALLAGTAAVFIVARSSAPEVPAAATPTASRTPTPTPTPLTASQTLLAQSDDPLACAVTLADAPTTPLLQTEGTLFAALPVRERDGSVFAGWYASPDAAATRAVDQRVNGSDAVSCNNQELTLYDGWASPDDVVAEDTGVPILMYHQFTTNPEGESGWLRGNYMYTGDFESHMAYIAETGFYLPTWDEMSAFMDGRLFLPNRSVVVTDDDADSSWLELGVPIVEANKVLATSFVITKWRQDATPSMYVLQRSHTNDMHEAGANGEGRMVNYTAEEVAADMQISADILGAKEVMAYPYGHYNDTAKEGLRMAGFEMARTIEQGYVRVGTDKLAMPCIRMNYGMNLDSLINLIG